MQLLIDAVKKRTQAKAASVLFLIALLVLAFSTLTIGAPGFMYGDVNEDGEVDVRDVVMVMQYILELRDLTEDQLKAADVTGDGEINIRDATQIMRYSLGLIDYFDVGEIIESVEEVKLEVSYGTKLENIEFPSTVKTTLQDETEEDIEVEWDDESDPEYNPRSAKDYVFEGKLVSLPSGVRNPDDIKAKATVTVYLPWVSIPTPRAPVEPDPPEEFTVTFNELNGLEGVSITVYSDADRTDEVDDLTTDSDGEAEIDLSDGNYWYTAELFGYEDHDGDFEVDGEDITVSFEMDELDKYTVTFVEGNELEGVSIKVYSDAGQTNEVADLTTDSDGEAEIDLSDGDYWYTAELFGYEDLDGDFEVDGEDITVTFEMDELDKYTVTFVEENELEDVSIKVYSDAVQTNEVADLTTDSDGEAEIDLPDGNYWYTAELFGYDDHDGDFTVSGEAKTVEFLMDEVLVVTGVETLEDITVPYGTKMADLPLPNEVEVTVEDKDRVESTQDMAVTWNSGSPGYDGDILGTYQFMGNLSPPEGVINPDNVKAYVNVIVEEDDQYEWPPEMEGPPSITYIDFPEDSWLVMITIKDAYKDIVTSVTILGEEAAQADDEKRWWAAFDHEVTLGDLESQILIETDLEEVDVIDQTKSRALTGGLGDTYVRVFLKPGEEAQSVTADGVPLIYNDTEERWESGALYGYSVGDEISVVVTTADGEQSVKLPVEEVN